MRTDLDGVVPEVIEVAVEVSAVAKPEIAANILRRLILLAAETGSRKMSSQSFPKEQRRAGAYPEGCVDSNSGARDGSRAPMLDGRSGSPPKSAMSASDRSRHRLSTACLRVLASDAFARTFLLRARLLDRCVRHREVLLKQGAPDRENTAASKGHATRVSE